MPKEYTLIGGNGTHVSPLSVTENDTYTAGDSKAFNPVIVNVPASAVDSGKKSITSNGDNQDVVGYAAVDVAVPNSYTAGDEGKVVSNGALVAQTSDTATQNGTVDTTLINSLLVNVSNDFSVANVTVENNSASLNLNADWPVLLNDGIFCEVIVDAGSTVVVQIPLYKGSCGFYWSLSDYSVAVTGAIAYADETITVSGDGTITITDYA